MTRWTWENTDGFTAAELAAMNDAQAALETAHPGVDATNIADMLGNAFVPGATSDDLVAAVTARLS